MTRLAQGRIHRAHQLAGVTIVNPESTTIDVYVAIGEDTTIEPSSVLRGTHAHRRALHASGRSAR